MKKIINDKYSIVEEALEGFIAINRRWYEKTGDAPGIVSKKKRRNKVSVIVGGGSGHEPMFGGFVGKGLGDAAVCGNIFASPNPAAICDVAEYVDRSKGIVFVYGNYAGDNMNFDMAEEMLRDDGVATAHVRVTDDCASAPKTRVTDRRGIAGDVFIVKIAGAAADAGYDLENVVRVAQKANANTSSIGIAVSPGQNPALDEPTFTLGEYEMEYGMGVHGEPGIRRTKMCTADEMTRQMLDMLLAEAGVRAGDEVCVLVNGLGGTTLLELGIVSREMMRILDEKQMRVYDSEMNSYVTSQCMGGFSITLMKLDDELKRLYDMPCYSPYYAQEGNDG